MTSSNRIRTCLVHEEIEESKEEQGDDVGRKDYVVDELVNLEGGVDKADNSNCYAKPAKVNILTATVKFSIQHKKRNYYCSSAHQKQ